MDIAPLSSRNPLLQMARMGKLRLPARTNPAIARWIDRLYPVAAAIFSLVAPLLASIPASVLAFAIWAAAAPNMPLDTFLYGDNYRLAFFLIASFLPIFFLLWVWIRLVEQRPLWSLGLRPERWLAKYLGGLGFGFLMMAGSVLLPAVFGFYSLQVSPNLIANPISLAGVAVAFIGWCVQGAGEEVLLRGYLMPVTSVRYGLIAGSLISSFIFSILHLLNENLTSLAILNLVLFGIFASLYALAEGGLWGIFALHSMWNWAQGSLFGLAVSGTKLAETAPFNFIENAPDWLTGGAFGPEGGLWVTGVLVISILITWNVLRRKGS